MIYPGEGEIRTRPCPDCCVCGAQGKPLYLALRDQLFGAPGEWNLSRCSNPDCGAVWINPMPLEGDIAEAYRNYHTHLGPKAPQNIWKRLRRLGYRQLRESYLSYKFGYQFDGKGTWRKVLARLIYITPFWRATLDRSAMYLYPRANGRLLDVGCGSGCLLEKYAGAGMASRGGGF